MYFYIYVSFIVPIKNVMINKSFSRGLTIQSLLLERESTLTCNSNLIEVGPDSLERHIQVIFFLPKARCLNQNVFLTV